MIERLREVQVRAHIIEHDAHLVAPLIPEDVRMALLLQLTVRSLDFHETSCLLKLHTSSRKQSYSVPGVRDSDARLMAPRWLPVIEL